MAFPFFLLLFRTPVKEGCKFKHFAFLCAQIKQSLYYHILFFFLREGPSPPPNNAVTVHTPINDVENRLSVHPWLI